MVRNGIANDFSADPTLHVKASALLLANGFKSRTFKILSD